jgi:hypothetical protein
LREIKSLTELDDLKKRLKVGWSTDVGGLKAEKYAKFELSEQSEFVII